MRSFVRWGTMLALCALAMVAGNGVATAVAAASDGPAKVAVTVLAQPNQQVVQGGVITYRVRALNNGDSPAQNVRVTLPIDPAKARLLDVRFEQSGSWVRALNADSILLEMPRLASGGVEATTILRVQLLAAAAPGDTLAVRAEYRFSRRNGNESGGGRSNLAAVRVGNADASVTVHPLAVTPTSDDPNRWSFTSDVFAPNEPVTVWYHTPQVDDVETEAKDGGVVSASSTHSDESGGAFVSANEEGRVQFSFRPRRLPSGTYIMVVRGAWTGLEAAGTFRVP